MIKKKTMYSLVNYVIVIVGALLFLSSKCDASETPIVFDYQQIITHELKGLPLHSVDLNKIFDKIWVRRMTKYIEELNATNKTLCTEQVALMSERWREPWALTMIDATGKLPSGILMGNINQLGQFDECLKVDHTPEGKETIKGKYCTARLPLHEVIKNYNTVSNVLRNTRTGISRAGNVDLAGKIFMNLGLCVPSSCSGDNVVEILQEFISITFPRMEALLPITVSDDFCSTAEPTPWKGGDYVAIIILVILALLLISSTVYDIVFRVWLKGGQHQKRDIYIAFSVVTNTERLLRVDPNPGPLSSLHGIRVMSILWVIICHRYTANLLSPIENFYDMMTWGASYWSMPILAAGVAVDTFFLMSGLLLSYTFFKHMNRQSFNVGIFYLHRYLRLTPPLAMMILLQATLFDHLGSGPFWKNLTPELSLSCRKYWWTTILYLQNYVNPKEICLGHTWYLSVDMQLYVLSPILLYPFLKNRKLGSILAVVWTVLSIILVFTLCFIFKWPAASMPLNASQQIVESRQINYYYTTHTRATPWLIGFCFGYKLRELLNRRVKLQLSWIVVCLGWFFSFLILGLVIFGMWPLQVESHVFSHWTDTTYLAFSRVGWTLAVIWIIFACSHGYGGPIDWFLSFPLWQVLARLTYSMYLIHLPMQFMMVATMRTVPLFKNGTFIHLYFGDAIASIVLAYCLTITMESPVTVIEKIIFRQDARPSPLMTPQDDLPASDSSSKDKPPQIFNLGQSSKEETNEDPEEEPKEESNEGPGEEPGDEIKKLDEESSSDDNQEKLNML